MDHPRPGLKYVAVSDLEGAKTAFENLSVEDPAGEKLGRVEGFVLDVDDGKPYYVVVDAGGWFRSKHVLIPIGHAMLDTELRKLIADLPKERIKRFPGFELDTFPTLTQQDLDRIAQETALACSPHLTIEPTVVVSQVEIRAHYRTPAWWDEHVQQTQPTDTRPRG